MNALAKRDPDIELAEDLGSFTHDPLRFVLYAFPWGVPGTELADHDGPREWQRKVLVQIGDALRAGATMQEAIRIAVASGHGVGKSAIVAWIILWALATCRDSKILLTANTEPQLRTKTWPEVSKWFRLLICAHWFKLTATSIFAANPKHEKTWRCDYVTWSENNTEAFAGLHNKGRRIVLLFDEASAIARLVWEVAEGALTDEDTEIVWCVFGNPTQNTGRFRECFGSLSHRWRGVQVDSRTVPGTNKVQIQQWQDDYGEDSDFFRIRVRGEFPRASAEQFIGHDIVAEARRRTAIGYEKLPKVLAVDVARFGDDQTVLAERQGQRFAILAAYRGLDTMQTAARVADAMDAGNYDAVFIDGVGVGGGVVDRLRQMNRKVIDVNAGAAATDDRQFYNKRAEMWSAAREWLKAGGCLPEKDEELASDLTSPEYFFDGKQRLCIEKKDDMKARGLRSPDRGDALTLTFAGKPVPRQEAPRKPRPGGGWMAAAWMFAIAAASAPQTGWMV